MRPATTTRHPSPIRKTSVDMFPPLVCLGKLNARNGGGFRNGTALGGVMITWYIPGESTHADKSE